MTQVIRFPTRHSAAVFVGETPEGGWIVIAREHGWLHGDAWGAYANACWLSENLGLPVRRTAS